MNRKATLAAAAALSMFSGVVSATDSLPSRAVGALSVAIASQGNAALLQIRRELKESAREAMKPFLPNDRRAPAQQSPAPAPAAQR